MTQKTRLLITILTVISFLTIFSSFVNSLEIDFNYPSEAELNAEFRASLDFEANGTYDLKIFVHNSPDAKVTRDEYISNIYNSEKNAWQDSWNYLAGSFPSQKEYSIKVTNSPGKRQICVRVRKTGSSSSFSKCGSITVTDVENAPNPTTNNPLGNNQINSPNNNQDSTQNAEDSLDSDKENVVAKTNNEDSPVQKTKENTQESQVYNDLSYNEIMNESQGQKTDKIYLNPKKSNESEQSIEVTTKKSKILFMMFYAFSFIGIVVLVMLILKRL